MCGLAGLFNYRTSEAESLVRGMIHSLHHRGPDQEGIHRSPDGRACLGHKRLSIVDLSAGRQPMTDAEGRFTLVFNGEIYNHHEVKRELLAKGHPIRSRSDTETLLYAYKEWGEACLPKLRGMFAFAVYDSREGTLFLGRDRLGIKPLYYALWNGTLAFASECKAILTLPGFDRSVDEQALSDYLSLMYVPAPRSIFRHIRKLPAGHWMRADASGGTRIASWWDLEFVDAGEYGREKDFGDAKRDLAEALEEAVTSHMESDVPLGAFLSGGVDSAAVVGYMARHSTQPILTNTIGFPVSAYDEMPYARSTAAAFGAIHHEHRVEAADLLDLDRVGWHYDEPFADSSLIPTYHVCRMARKNVTVALSGDGGDENFAGYRRYYYDSLENRVRAALPAPVRAPLFGLAGALYPKADWLPRPLRAKTLLRNLSYDPLRGYFTTMSHILPDAKRRLLSGDLLASLKDYDPIESFRPHWDRCRTRDPLSRVQYLDMKTYLVDDILTKVDRASMAVSLEVRVPVLDHKVVELAARMPSSWKLRGRASKYVFKQALEGLVPAEVFTRPKTGFSIPLKEWLRHELRDYARENLLGASGLAGSGWFRKESLEAMLKEHQGGLRDHAYPLFALLSLAVWKRLFLDGKGGPVPAPAASPA